MSKPIKHDPQWAEAKCLCRLNMEDIRKAKQLGLSPKALMKNIPAPSQKWKLPVKLWIAELHEKRFGRGRYPQARSAGLAQVPGSPAPSQARIDDENVPF
jgi:hypothetical protein